MRIGYVPDVQAKPGNDFAFLGRVGRYLAEKRPDVIAGRWVLLDFVDFVVHLFHPEARAFYQLERLWDDAPALTPRP